MCVTQRIITDKMLEIATFALVHRACVLNDCCILLTDFSCDYPSVDQRWLLEGWQRAGIRRTLRDIRQCIYSEAVTSVGTCWRGVKQGMPNKWFFPVSTLRGLIIVFVVSRVSDVNGLKQKSGGLGRWGCGDIAMSLLSFLAMTHMRSCHCHCGHEGTDFHHHIRCNLHKTFHHFKSIHHFLHFSNLPTTNNHDVLPQHAGPFGRFAIQSPLTAQVPRGVRQFGEYSSESFFEEIKVLLVTKFR